MPIETPPHDLLPVGFKPRNGTAYQVQDGDDWYSVAKTKKVYVQDLIWFNFHTEEPNEINWYLRHRTGCNKPTRDRLNWMFSSSARPGIIYVPPPKWHRARKHHPATSKADKTKVIDGDAWTTTSKRKAVTSPFAKTFEGPVDNLDTISRTADIFTLVDLGLAIAGLEAGAGWMVAGFAVTFAAPWLALSGGEAAALTELRVKYTKRGLALGIILGADGRKDKWIVDTGLWKQHPDKLVGFEPYEKQLMGIFNTSLFSGLQHGRQFSTVALVNMLGFLTSKMTNYAKAEYLGYPNPMTSKEWLEYSRKWSARKWYDYYNLLAAIFEEHVELD